MNESDKKLAAEEILYPPECWHTFKSSQYFSFPDRCLECGKLITSLDRRTFTTQADMMAIYSGIFKRGKWGEFEIFAFNRWNKPAGFRFNPWFFCLDGQDYGPRCQMAVDFWKETVK